ncbi:MAG: GNAT family N-acetyltransferase [Gammaproteobacteria bacterium]
MLTENKAENIIIKIIEPARAREACRTITTTLPEWFGIPEANARYEEGILERLSFAAYMEDIIVGMIVLEFPYPSTANIYWMAVNKFYRNKSIGTKLLMTAENYCYEKQLSTLTVETLSPKQKDDNYLVTYHFYEKSGFKPLFDNYTYDPDTLMVYMQKTISLDDYIFIDLTHSLSADVPHWGIDVGFKYNIRQIQSADAAGKMQFRVQRLEMSAGIGTHLDAPSHCYEDAAAIDAIPLQSLITVCRVIDVSDKVHDRYSVTIDDVRQFENQYGTIPKNAFVIIHTGWDERWNQPGKYRNEKIFPNISPDAVKLLLTRNIAGLGIDTLSPDAFGSDFPVHQLILGAGKYIIENVANAKQLDPVGAYIFALPMKITDGTEAPVRLIGMQKRR